MYPTDQAINEYRSTSVRSDVLEATPHRLVQMLFEGALERIQTARIAMEAGNLGLKADRIKRALDIVHGLRDHLDMEKGGEIAANLDALYEYMELRLTQANLRNEVEILDEVAKLLGEIKAGWDGIGPQREGSEAPKATSVAAAVAEVPERAVSGKPGGPRSLADAFTQVLDDEEMPRSRISESS